MTEENPDRVNVGMDFKRNLGNFQSMGVHISLSSSAKDDEDAEALFRRVYDFVEEHFLAEFDGTEQEVKEAFKDAKKAALPKGK